MTDGLGVDRHLTENVDDGTIIPADQRYRVLIEAITDYAVYMLDADGIIVSWNTGAERIKGYKPEEIIGQHFSRLYTPDDRQRGLPEKALATATTQGRYVSEGWRVRKDGSRFWTHAVIDSIRDHSGRLVGFAKVTRDLTERKAAEEALKRTEEQFRLLVQGVTDYAIFMLDPKGHIVSWNLGAERIKGYTPDEVIGQHFSRFYLEEERERGEPKRTLAAAAAAGHLEKEGWRVRKDGTRFWASVVIDAIHDSDGELIGFAKVTRDITEKREAQRALEEAREALFQAQKLETIGQLTGGVAHDFNNLLMVILSSLDLLRRRVPNDDRVRTLLDNAAQAAQRGASLTQRMLAFARRQELKRTAVDIPELVSGISDLLQRTLGPSIRIEMRFPPMLSRVHTDPNQLESALLNLALNARDAMPAGGPLLIAAREESVGPFHPTGLKPGSYVCLSVEDEGEGMDEETLARAIDPFFTTKGVGKGTGLGLSMVQGLAGQSGGRLRLVSKKGAGTTAELWLPVALDERAAEAPQEFSVETATEKARSLVIMVVDDDPLVLMNTAVMLEDLGHTVIGAESGEEALNALREQNNDIDLILTDQAMPRMRGDQLAEAIMTEWPHLPVILATGYAEAPTGRASRLPKLAKPFTQQQLEEKIADTIFARA